MTHDLDGIEAVIFDMDGVLVDSEDLIKRCETRVLAEEEDIHVSESEVEAHEGMATREYFAKMIRTKGDAEYTDEELAERTRGLERKKLDLYFDSIDEIEIIDGAVETVRSLAEDFKMAVASNSEREMVEHVVEHLGIEDAVDTTASFTDVARGKPEPDVFHHASEELGVEPGDAVVLEDSEAGTRAAVEGGYHTFRFRGEELDGVVGRVDSLQEFEELVRDAGR